MSNAEVAKKLRGLRIKLSPLLNDDAKATLLEAERITGGAAVPPGKLSKITPKRKPTKAELKLKFHSKGL